MHFIALPAFTDNYIWMICEGQQAIVVDPGDAAPVQAALQRLGLSLEAILVTHQHRDHIGGINALRPLLQGRVHGPARDHVPLPYEPLQHGDTLALCGLHFDVLDMPGHTPGHIAYFMPATVNSPPALLCGDVLFSAGCGRLFEAAAAAQMQASLALLATLPDSTQIYCAHEYTLDNLAFARAVEPANAALAPHEQWCKAQRAYAQPTLPTTLAQERLINPFLRWAEPAVVQAAQRHGARTTAAADVFAALRYWKNDFR